MEFSEEQWAGLRRHAAERGLWFVCSPFSLEAVELLMRVEPDAWKIASGEISSFHALDRMLSTKLPVLVSTGMSRLSEVDAAVRRVTATACPLAVLQCTTAYPCPPEKVGLNMIPLYRERYGCAVGLSDHSGTVFPGLAAATIGVDVLELHVTMSREMFGPDVPASVTTTEFRQLVDGVRYIEKMTANPVDKDALAGEADSLRTVFTKSIVTRVALPAGTRLEEHHLAFRKPGTGIPESMMQQVLSRRLKRALPANTILREDYLE
jgi:N-acetylneuraminate synthase